ncbi:MAG: autotransporter domain-containing protein [Proteobacteria bacterium]|nr:autotransporter domain-containing protein [Pseudomonadota bacterium]
MLITAGASSTNSGTVTTYGATAHALYTFGSTTYNSGTLSTNGTGAAAIYADGTSVFYNSGTLAAYASGAHAVYALSQAKVHLQTGTRILDGDVYAANASATWLYLDGSGTVDFDITGGWQGIHKTQAGTWTITRAPVSVRYFIDEGTLALATGTSFAADSITLYTGSTLALNSGTTVSLGAWGDYNQAAGSTLALTLNNSGGPYITAPNSATIAGGLSLDVPYSALGTTQVIIDTAALTGGFSSITSSNPNFSFDSATVAAGLGQQIQLTGVTYAPQYDNSAMGLSSAMGATQAFMGVPGNRTSNLLSENQDQGEFMVASSEPLVDLVSKRSNGDRYGIYVQPMFNVSQRDAFGSGPGYSANMAGVEIGADTFVLDDLLLGAFIGTAVTDINFEGLAFAENDSEDQQLYTLGIYGGYRLGDWRLSDTLSFTHSEHESKRNAGLGEMAKGDYDSQVLSNQLLASYGWAVNDTWELAPELGLNTSYLNRGGFSETDATNAVEYADFDKFFVESVAGLRLRGSFEAGSTRISPYARLSWSHDLGGNDITVGQTLGTTAVEATQKNDDDRLGLDLGLSLREGDATFTLAYGGEFSEHSESHGLTANLRLEF